MSRIAPFHSLFLFILLTTLYRRMQTTFGFIFFNLFIYVQSLTGIILHTVRYFYVFL